MSETVIAAIIVALVTAAGSAGVWQYRTSRRAEPITQRAADLVVADTSQKMALAVAAAIQVHSEGLTKQLGDTQQELNRLEGRFTALETHVREQEETIRLQSRTIRKFNAAWDDLTARWQAVRLLDKPPDRPPATTE